MARILCCWERGAALGHLANLRPFIERAVAEGHDVILAARDLRNVPQVFGTMPIRLFQAPVAGLSPVPDAPRIRSVGMLLESFYGQGTGLLDLLVRAWGYLFDAVAPDLVIYDHAPTALIASLDRPWMKWVVGSGFMIPRKDQDPFGQFPPKPGSPIPDDTAPPDEDIRVLAMINEHLEGRGCPRIESLAAIWKQADRDWLMTLPELDHFGERAGTPYLGIPAGGFARSSIWPDRPGPKVMGYLAQCDALHPLLAVLDRQPINGMFYTRDLSSAEIARYPNLTIQTTPLDFPALLPSADLMINMAGHKSVVEAYLAGVPQLMIVRHQEQLLLAWRVMAIKAGVAISAKTVELGKPLQAAFALVKRGIPKLDPQHAEDMQGACLAREIDTAFETLSAAPG